MIAALSVIAASTVGLVAALALFSFLAARRIERQVPADGQFLIVNGTRLHYLDQGHGPVIVMIHGLGGQMRNFRYALAERLATDHRVILVDRPGSGYSAAAPSAAIPDQAALIAGLIDALGLERPLVVGHSLGGAVALALALDHPGRIGGIALLAPLTQSQQTVHPAFRGLDIASPLLRGVLSWTLATPLGMLSGRRGATAVFAPEPAPEDFAIRGGGALVLRPGSFRAASADLAAARDGMAALVARYADLAVPAAILFGQEDEILDPAIHGTQTAAQAPGVALHLIPGGHMIPITAPDTVAAWIRERVPAGHG